MNTSELTQNALKGLELDISICRDILQPDKYDILPLINAAYEVRKHFWRNEVTVHILNNAQNGFCPEDCAYCAQAKSSKSDIADYPLKPENEILAEAESAYKNGAFRYCMVFAGRGPSRSRVEKLAGLIKKIKSKYPLEICVSAGLLDETKAAILKDAGLDRLNHNLNTSQKHYPEICSTHTYEDRLQTLSAARQAGIQLCSGAIIGMGETNDDIIEVAQTLRKLKAESIPVNFFIPIKGNTVKQTQNLSPQYGLRVLCLFRFLNPDAEIRIAAGRELHFGSLEALTLFPANSLFMDGYLNAKGHSNQRTVKMIHDAGFTIKSEIPIEELLNHDEPAADKQNPSPAQLKNWEELRPKRNFISNP